MPVIVFPDGTKIDSATGEAPPDPAEVAEKLAREERRRAQRAERDRQRQERVGRERSVWDFQRGPGSFDVGYGGNKPDWGGTFANLPSIGAPNLGAITQEQFEAAMADFDKEIGRDIGPGRFGAFGAAMGARAIQGQGFGDAIMKRILTRLAEREAGVRAAGQNDLANVMARGGLAGNTSAAEALRQSLVAQSSSRLSSAELDAEIQDAMLRKQDEASARQAALGLTGIDADLAKAAALFKGSIPRPLVGGGGKRGADGSLMGAGGAPLVYGDGRTNVGDPRNRLPGESLADQIRREAGERAAAGYGQA
jgi:hypothetical protein